MALPAYALVTLDQAKTHLGVTDAERDAVLGTLIAQVSRAVLNATGREYAPAADGLTRVVALKNGSSVIDLYPYELRACTGVTIDPGGDSEYEVTLADFQLEPVGAPDGVYDRIKLPDGYSASSKFGNVLVSVSGDWGWDAVPADVQGWVLEMVEDRWKQDHAFYADADGFVTDSPVAPASGPVTIPFRIRDEMEAVKRVRIGSV